MSKKSIAVFLILLVAVVLEVAIVEGAACDKATDKSGAEL
jgi:hypothetical protein